LVGLVSVGALWRTSILFQILGFANNPFGLTRAEAQRLDSADTSSSYLVLFGAVVSGICFLGWESRGRNALFFASPSALRMPNGWAIGSWFIPIANWIVPVFGIRDMDNAAHGETKARFAPVIVGWWAAWIFGAIVAQWYIRMNPTSLEEIKRMVTLGIAGQLVLATGGILFILVIRRITRAMVARAAQA